jgi:hypothetical protein
MTSAEAGGSSARTRYSPRTRLRSDDTWPHIRPAMRRLLRWLRRWFGRGGREVAGGLPS